MITKEISLSDCFAPVTMRYCYRSRCMCNLNTNGVINNLSGVCVGKKTRLNGHWQDFALQISLLTACSRFECFIVHGLPFQIIVQCLKHNFATKTNTGIKTTTAITFYDLCVFMFTLPNFLRHIAIKLDKGNNITPTPSF